MKFRLITDDYNTLVGMRLAGIEGEQVENTEQLISSLEKAVNDKEVGIVMLNDSLALSIPKQLLEIKKNSATLIVEIPDRNSTGSTGDSITRYVADAIGVR